MSSQMTEMKSLRDFKQGERSPLFFFASQVSGDKINVPQVEGRKVYLWELCRPFDGVLISIAYLKSKRDEIKELGVKKFFHIPNDLFVMGDCGAWQYKHLDEVPYKPEEIVEFYEKSGYDFGITLDQLVMKSKLTWKEKGEVCTRIFDQTDHKRRMDFTLNSAKIMKEVSSGKTVLFASVQGVTVSDYVRMTKQYLDMGYNHLALGGVAKTNTKVLQLIISNVMNCIEQYGMENITKVHVLGVGRPSMWDFYKTEGIFSFDTSRYHRLAWMKGEYVYWDGFRLKNFDVRAYDYRQFTHDPPLPDCSCPICRIVGVDKDGISWVKRFGTNQRNMSRGFHNLYHFRLFYETKMKKTLVLIACSNKKLKIETTAKNMYQGRLFKLAKLFAMRHGYDYKIISAKYGLLSPDTIIKPYDQQIKTKKDINKIQCLVIPKLKDIIRHYGVVLVIAGVKYREVLEPLWDERFVFPKSRGYGDLCKKIGEQIPQIKLDNWTKQSH